MTEQEYIDATNLAKIRTAMGILRDVLDMTKKETELKRSAYIALSNLEQLTSKKVKTKEVK